MTLYYYYYIACHMQIWGVILVDVDIINNKSLTKYNSFILVSKMNLKLRNRPYKIKKGYSERGDVITDI